MFKIKPAQIAVVMLVTMLVLPLHISAQSIEGAPTTYTDDDLIYYTAGGVSAARSYYAVSEELTINSGGENDVVAAGGNVILDVDVNDNVAIVAGNLVINGNVAGDVWVAAGGVILNGDVTGDVRIVAGSVFVNSKQISGELMVAGGELHISSNTQVLGGIAHSTARFEDNVTKMPTSLVDLPKYGGWGKDWAVVMDSVVKGALFFLVLFAVVWAIGSVIAGYLALRLFPTFAEKTIFTMEAKPVQAILVGIGILIVIPFISILLLISVIGIPVFGLLVLLACLALMLAVLYAQYAVGRLFFKRLGNYRTGRLLPLVTGIFLITFGTKLLEFIPVIGIMLSSFIWFMLTSWGIGAILLNKIKSQKVTSN